MKQGLLLIIVCVLMSCSKSHSTYFNSYGSSPQSLLSDVAGPVIRIDSIPLAVGHTWYYSSTNYRYTVKVVADTIINGEHAAEVCTYGDTIISIAYYANRGDGYYLIANRYLHPDSLSIFNPSVRMLSFPIAIGSAWYVLGNHYNLFTYQWLDFDLVGTNIGTFNACKLSCIAQDGLPIVYDYYSTKGLVKELVIAAGSKGPGEGPVYYVIDSIILISMNF